MKQIPGYPNYLACEKGFIYSKNYRHTRKLGRLKCILLSNGYVKVGLCKEGKTKQFTIHYLIMITFKGERKKGYQINHKNGIKSDNRISNLEYCTAKENIQHAINTGLHNPVGEANKCSLLKRSDVVEIKNSLKNNYRGLQSELGRKYNVSFDVIHKIAIGKNWKHITV